MTQILASPKAVSTKLEQAGAYAVGADELQTSLTRSLTAANIPEPVAKSVVSVSVTATSVATAAQPAISSVTSWLTSTSARPLAIGLDLSGIKAQIERQAKLKGSPEVGFVATREIQDEYALVDQKNQQSFEGIKTSYQQAVQMMPMLGLGVLIGLALLVIMAIRQPSKRLAWPAWVLLIAGGVIMLLIVAIPVIAQLTLPKGTNSFAPIGVGLARALAESARGYGYALLTLGAGLLAFSAVVKHNHKKKDKKKH